MILTLMRSFLTGFVRLLERSGRSHIFFDASENFDFDSSLPLTFPTPTLPFRFFSCRLPFPSPVSGPAPCTTSTCLVVLLTSLMEPLIAPTNSALLEPSRTTLFNLKSSPLPPGLTLVTLPSLLPSLSSSTSSVMSINPFTSVGRTIAEETLFAALSLARIPTSILFGILA